VRAAVGDSCPKIDEPRDNKFAVVYLLGQGHSPTAISAKLSVSISFVGEVLQCFAPVRAQLDACGASSTLPLAVKPVSPPATRSDEVRVRLRTACPLPSCC